MPVHVTPRRVVIFTALFVLAYIVWRGPFRFFFESTGTCILSPVIYTRILPPTLSHWLVSELVRHPFFGNLLCLAPIALLGLSMALAVYSLCRNSLPAAFASWLIVGGVFSVYHHLQPLGITVVYL